MGRSGSCLVRQVFRRTEYTVPCLSPAADVLVFRLGKGRNQLYLGRWAPVCTWCIGLGPWLFVASGVPAGFGLVSGFPDLWSDLSGRVWEAIHWAWV